MWGGSLSGVENHYAHQAMKCVGANPSASRRRIVVLAVAGVLLGLGLPGLAQAQGEPVPQSPVGSRPGLVGTMRDATSAALTAGKIIVVVTDESGGAPASTPRITVTSNSFNNLILKPPTRSGNVWVFQPVPAGDQYVVRVDAPGYEAEQLFVSLPSAAGVSERVAFHLRMAGSQRQLGLDTAHFLLAPASQRELQQGMKDLRSNKMGSARKHLEKVLQTAPANAGVNYLVGLTYLMDGRESQATPYLEKAVASDPKQVAALVALGTIRYQQGNNQAAIETLTKALKQDPGSWQAEWMLAESYVRERKYAEARQHAESALTASRGKASRVQLILGEALAGLGKPAEAASALERFAKENAGDEETRQVREWVKRLRQPATAAEAEKEIVAKAAPPDESGGIRVPRRKVGMALAPSAPPAELPPDTSWMPPDVDTAGPPVVSGASCPLSSVLKKAGKGMAHFITDLQDFSATEEFQLVKLDRQGKVGTPFERKFDYLLFVQKLRPHLFGIEEMRNQQFGLPNMGGPVVDTASASLALVFHPVYQGDFEWKCEGLGQWNGKPAWVVHFQQRSDRPTSRLAGFETPTHEYRLALKGRAWLMEKTGQVLHLEADLMKPVKAVQLDREHFAIDYREVRFTTHPVKLWLPENVNTYIEYRGRGYHEYHHYGNFKLFWVGTEQKISEPKETKPKETKKKQ
jgi:tetratricopeptide (TPR) repeat protein